MSTKADEKEDTFTSPDSEKRNEPSTPQVEEILDKENIRKRKWVDEVDRDDHFEEFSGLESNKSKKKKKNKSFEKSKLATLEDSTRFGANISEKKGNMDDLNEGGRKGDIITGKKSKNIGVEIGGEKLVENAMKEVRQKSEKTAKIAPIDTKCSPMRVKVDEKVNLVNKVGGSRR